MAQNLDVFDLLLLSAVLVGTVAFFTKGKLWAKKLPNGGFAAASTATLQSGTRSIVQKLADSDRDAVIFYGSQTGTAEDYASRLAKEGHARFGLKTMVADLEDYDYEDLDEFPQEKIAIFVMATYGEGEPTDNAAQFFEFITDPEPSFSGNGEDSENPLSNLNFVAFGLGNNTYEYYNAIITNLNDALVKLGATRLGDVGMGDDGTGTMEEDFLTWKEDMWARVAEAFDLQEREAVYEPAVKVEELLEIESSNATVYLGEPNKAHLAGTESAPFLPTNPYVAQVIKTKELFHSDSRNCLHVEIDLADSGLKFTTGDHIAVWPQNSNREVDRFLKIFGLAGKRDTVISVSATDPTVKVPFPSPTTYDAAVRYHLEINGIVSRQFLATLVAFAPNDKAKEEISRLGSDRAYFSDTVSSNYLNVSQVLQRISGDDEWSAVPFALLTESIPHVQPRYYSISSSSYVNKTKPHITVVVESIATTNETDDLKGVASNYLLDLKNHQHGEVSGNSVSYAVDGPRGKYAGIKVPVHIRHSNFKLPSNPKTPIIMIGPGTGVAPFRGFVSERVAQAANDVPVGKSLLFFGSRNRNEDFLYENEWQDAAEKLADKFELVTAFSRQDENKKVYVQHRLLEYAAEVNKLLQAGAYFYVCGDASRMAKEVSATLGKIIAKERAISDEQADEVVKSLRAQNLYQEDVWS
ncbi:hypothetical protein V1514DRAFT_50048 [Lipomyces japonicus]|uniref:uncharacterized protein n=1 Tax=Lipomyces japonicus TaxID=56871 RepID=UPI0034CE0838